MEKQNDSDTGMDAYKCFSYSFFPNKDLYLKFQAPHPFPLCWRSLLAADVGGCTQELLP